MGPYEVIIAGGGHNGLTVASYLAKAGLKTLVLEEKEYVGGGCVTREVCAPGFRSDLASGAHGFIWGNPLLRNDELDLLSKFGLEYIHIDGIFGNVFPDDTCLGIRKDVEATCESIAKFSQHDAAAYHRFYEWGHQNVEVVLAGMFAPTPSFGTFNSMMEGSREGREFMRLMYTSGHDLAAEWFEDERTIIALDRATSENMMDPRVDGSGMNLLMCVALNHDFGVSIPKGGSGALSDAMVRSIEARGGEVRCNALVKEFIVSGGRCTGVVLADGERITATKAVVTSSHISQLGPEMLPGADLPDEYVHNIKVGRHTSFQAFHQAYALDVLPELKAGAEANSCLLREMDPGSLPELNQTWNDYAAGKVVTNSVLALHHSQYDPSRAPEGHHTLYLYHYEPYNLAEGPEHWNDIREEVADQLFEAYASRCTNLSRANIVGQRWVSSPYDFAKFNRSWVQGDFFHLGAQISQSGGLRPFPLVSDYRLPAQGLYLCGPSAYPGGGIAGGGRAVSAVVLDDLGIDFNSVIK